MDDASRPTILVVDDHLQNRKLVAILLRGEGYDVRTAADAEEALEILEYFEPQLILMDIHLPGMDGLSLTRRLKSDSKRRHILILALTAYAMKGDADRALAAGCDGYLSKPFDPDVLCELLAEWLRRDRPLERRARSDGTAGAD